jgi:hypothetical protein
VVSVDSVNSPGDHVLARRLVADRTQLDPILAVDAATPLKATLAGVRL